MTNLCPDGEHCHAGSNHLDLSSNAFTALATTESGVINVRWRYVPCTLNGGTGNAKLIIKSGSSNGWMQ